MATYDGLLADAMAAKASVTSYLNHLYYPEGWDSVVFAGEDVAGFFSRNPCYAQPEASLLKNLSGLEKVILQLTATKIASEQFQGKSGARAAGVAATTSAAPTLKAIC